MSKPTSANNERIDPPQPDGYPIVRNAMGFQRADDPIHHMNSLLEEHGDVVKLKVFNRDLYLTRNPDHGLQMFLEENDKWKKSSVQQKQFEPFMGRDVLTSEGDRWRHQRKLLDPLINRNRLENFVPDMVEYTQQAMESWDEGEVIDIQLESTARTVEIACKVIFDWEAGELAETIGEDFQIVTRHLFGGTLGVSPPNWIPTPGNRRFNKSLQRLYRIADEIIEDCREMETDNEVANLIKRTFEYDDEVERELTEEVLRKKVLNMIFGGHETTAQGLTWTWYLLSMNPDVKRRLNQELDSVLGDQPPSPEDLPDLEYLEAILKESWRLYPPSYGIMREPTEDVELDGYHIPEGVTVVLLLWGVHRHPEYWDDPYAFDPDRWMGDERPVEHRYAHAPFSAGPRRCAGEPFAMVESKTVMATMAQQYDMELVTEPPIQMDTSLTTQPVDGIEMIPRER